jgi:NADH:ubiquinone oxidoreductase subunit 3 (subunit A)
MSVLRGSFRLSVVIALVALLCSAVYAHFTALDAEQQAAESWRTLRCGQMFLNRDMGDYTNQYGLIDIGTAGCSYKGRFLATPDEIRAAVSSPPPESKYGEAFQQMLSVLILRAVLGVFLLVNLLGLLFLAARGALRWVRAGYR